MNENPLSNKDLIIGVTGSIAAYKSVELVSELVKNEANISVILTQNAKRFILPPSYAFLSKVNVYSELFSEDIRSMISHIDIARNAHCMAIVPATANIIAKIANGIADDLLSSVALYAKCPIVIAPAMNSAMYEKPQTQENLRRLESLGVRIVGPEAGWLACGDEGVGRLASIEDIIQVITEEVKRRSLLAGKRILVTLGGTEEPIDDVRVITNRSSGKMGAFIASEAVAMGADVIVVAGRVSVPLPSGAKIIRAYTVQEMLSAVLENAKGMDATVLCAAVSDFKVARAPGKIKKSDAPIKLMLEKNTDIASELSSSKQGGYLLGFSADSSSVLENAQEKLRTKGFNAIVTNDVSRSDIGFESDYNEVTYITASGEKFFIPRKYKRLVARELLEILSRYI
ncbi:MAG: bifunctional phosphopantothenoylcysteine decarboxylase/phosphopantothenate--cysteine ligase CoaBC [Actinobacteria bacterium]|nr:bifunctional phosphopantothenoylcysteine decarboxylase/phosphopantothenate--cysteine ligase CoaBC [Actinomycetota bacterium]